jgi:DNA-binding transcriptional LysR family regulator
VRLLERTTHHVQLTPGGSAFLREARQILVHVNRAAVAAQRAAGTATLRVGVMDASYDSMPQILRAVRELYPDLVIHQVEAGVPEQFRMLVDGRLDVGLGRASLAPLEVAAELFRLDPLGVLIPEGHRLAGLPGVPVATLAAEPLLLAEEGRAPEFNQFLVDLCRSVGFVPTVYRGTVESLRAAADLVAQACCVVCAPASGRSAAPRTVWRPLVEPVPRYPWSLLWRAEDRSEQVDWVVAAARQLSREQGWLAPASQAAG